MNDAIYSEVLQSTNVQKLTYHLQSAAHLNSRDYIIQTFCMTNVLQGVSTSLYNR